MHVEDYGLIERKGVQIGVGTLKSGLVVALYAKRDGEEVETASSDKYLVVSTTDSDVILSALEGEESAISSISSLPSDFSFGAISLLDHSYILGRKTGKRTELWRYNAFDGFGRVLAHDSDPLVLDWAEDFSSFLDKLWASLPEYRELCVNLEGGKRVFNK